jgi:hypothetical protein
MSDKTSCDKLAAELARNAAGRTLVDVKFYVNNPKGVATERLCEDVAGLLAAEGVVLRSPKI